MDRYELLLEEERELKRKTSMEGIQIIGLEKFWRIFLRLVLGKKFEKPVLYFSYSASKLGYFNSIWVGVESSLQT